jgi:glycosyltransferase involved in cell wall biosynthesis
VGSSLSSRTIPSTLTPISKTSPHIVFLTPGFPAGLDDDSCIPALHVFTRAFKQRFPQISLSVISLQYPYRNGTYDWNGISIHACGGGNRGGIRRFTTWRKCLNTLNRLHKEQPITQIHSFWLQETALLGNRFAKKRNIPHLISLMGQDVLPDNPYLKWISLEYPEVISLSKPHSEAFRRTTGRNPSAEIPWGVDPADFPPLPDVTKEIDILGVGSLIGLKRWAWFVETIARLKPLFPSIRACIAGAGPEADSLTKLTEEAGLTSNLRFTGGISRKEVLGLMAKSRILLHPAQFESFGYVYAEALYSGLYLVSFETGFAKSSERWGVASTKEELFQHVRQFLELPVRQENRILHSVQHTVDAYANRYGLTKY